MKMKRLLLLLMFVMSAKFISAESQVEVLASTEKKFAQTSVEKGITESFLSFLAEDSILFRPGPVSGRQWMSEHPPRPGLLKWTPSYAEASAGDFGFTTGPWEFRKSATEEPAGYGQFLSVWKKQPDGGWKVLVDCGIEYPKPSSSQLQTATELGPVPQKRAASSEREDTALANMDRSIQTLPALGERLANRSFLLRNGMMPVRGNEAIRKFLRTQNGGWSFQVDKAGVSSSGDLGYTYGTYERKMQDKTETGIYMRVWRFEDSWRIAADLILPSS